MQLLGDQPQTSEGGAPKLPPFIKLERKTH